MGDFFIAAHTAAVPPLGVALAPATPHCPFALGYAPLPWGTPRVRGDQSPFSPVAYRQGFRFGFGVVSVLAPGDGSTLVLVPNVWLLVGQGSEFLAPQAAGRRPAPPGAEGPRRLLGGSGGQRPPENCFD